MKVVNPAPITPTTLLASSVAVDDAPAWVAGSYAAGVEVVRNLTRYQSLVDSNTVTPGAETATPYKWLELGPVNRWRMFNKRKGTSWQIGTFTEAPEVIDITIRPGRVVNALGLVGVAASSVRVIMQDPVEGVVYDRTLSLIDASCANWYEYFFKPIERRDGAALFDLPAYGTADVRVIISAPGGVARVGTLILGQAMELGEGAYPVDFGGDSYTATKMDAFGNAEITPRPSRDSLTYTFYTDESQASGVRRLLRQLKDAPALYVGREDLDITIIAGRAEEPSGTLIAPGTVEFRLEIRSLQ